MPSSIPLAHLFFEQYIPHGGSCVAAAAELRPLEDLFLLLGSGFGGVGWSPPPPRPLCHGIHKLAPELLGDSVVGSSFLVLERSRVERLVLLRRVVHIN